VWRCQGRCGARWLAEGAQLIDLASLPFGACSCCELPHALVRAEQGAACPASGLAYLLLPEGPRQLAEVAPHGLCRCCAPPMPLLLIEGVLVCRARPTQHYRRVGGQIVPAPAAPGDAGADVLAAIDAALRRNSARVTVNGLFDVDEPDR
jgi:hypothetical protein